MCTLTSSAAIVFFFDHAHVLVAEHLSDMLGHAKASIVDGNPA
jgi:hypothetical protein